MKNKRFIDRLGFAVNGLVHAIKSEKSVRTHLAATLGVFTILGVVQPELFWWAIVTLVAINVIAAELINTAIETLCDRIHPDHDPAIKLIKDIGAGAVLVVSAGAIVIGILLGISLTGR